METPGEHAYYWHPESGEVRWEPPADARPPANAAAGTSDAVPETTALPAGWQRVEQPGEHPYYWCAESGEVRWEPPSPQLQLQPQSAAPEKQPPQPKEAPQQPAAARQGEQSLQLEQPLHRNEPREEAQREEDDAKRRRLNNPPAAGATAQPALAPPAMIPQPMAPPISQGAVRPAMPQLYPRPIPPIPPASPMQVRPFGMAGGTVAPPMPPPHASGLRAAPQAGAPLPPPHQHALLSPADQGLMEQTATFIVSNGDRVISMLLNNQKLAFLHPTHPHNAHFCMVLDGCRRKSAVAAEAGRRL